MAPIEDTYDSVLETWVEAEDKLKPGLVYQLTGKQGKWRLYVGQKATQHSSLFDALTHMVNHDA